MSRDEHATLKFYFIYIWIFTLTGTEVFHSFVWMHINTRNDLNPAQSWKHRLDTQTASLHELRSTAERLRWDDCSSQMAQYRFLSCILYFIQLVVYDLMAKHAQQSAQHYDKASEQCCVQLFFTLETAFALCHKKLRQRHICLLWAIAPYCVNARRLSSEQEAERHNVIALT